VKLDVPESGPGSSAPSKKVSAGVHAFCAVRKKLLQACETFSPSEKSFRTRVCLLNHPKKVSAAINTFSATGNFFVQRLGLTREGRWHYGSAQR